MRSVLCPVDTGREDSKGDHLITMSVYSCHDIDKAAKVSVTSRGDGWVGTDHAMSQTA